MSFSVYSIFLDVLRIKPFTEMVKIHAVLYAIVAHPCTTKGCEEGTAA
jgi:hypothetical protein